MEGLNELQMACFEIISLVGTAKSSYIEAIQLAKTGDFEGAEALIQEGEQIFVEGHDVHMRLLQQDASGAGVGCSPLILLHAEDQMMSTEVIHIMAQELIETHRKLAKIKE